MARRRSGVGVAVAVASVAVDLAAAEQLKASDRSGLRWRSAIATADAAIWSAIGDADVRTVRTITIASSVAESLEYGYRAFTPDDLIPTMPSDGGSQRAEAVNNLAALMPPLLAASTIRKLRGQPLMPGQAGWVAFGYAVGVGVGSFRTRLQRQARRRWADRTGWLLGREHHLEQLRAILTDNPGHQFKNALSVLGLYSERAKGAASEQMDRPRLAVETSHGTTLWQASHKAEIEPPDMRSLWLTAAQVRQLDAFVDKAETDLVDSLDEVFTVETAGGEFGLPVSGQGFTIRYLGSRAIIRPSLPVLELIVDGAPVGFVASSLWKVLSWGRLPTGVLPAWAATAWIIPDAVGIGTHIVTNGWPQHDRLVNLAAAVSATGFAITVNRMQREFTLADGTPAFPATSPVAGSMGILGHYWDRLGPERFALFGLYTSLVALASPRRARRFPDVAFELCFPLMTFFAAKGLQSRTDAERDHVVREFQREYEVAVGMGRLAAIHEQLDYYRGQLMLARQELARPDLRLPDGDRDGLTARCDELEAWLSRAQSEANVAKYLGQH